MDVNEINSRKKFLQSKVIVIKIGTSSLTNSDTQIDSRIIDKVVNAVAAGVAAGKKIILVSSGAVGCGLAPLKLHDRPNSIPTQQAVAAVGQSILISAWAKSFAKYNFPVGQILLTSHDIAIRKHYINAQKTINKLNQFGAIPIINENDSVTYNELKFGDNDYLAALVATLVKADGLLLLSDVEGLLSAPPSAKSAKLISQVTNFSDIAYLEKGNIKSKLGTGGIVTKIMAAKLAVNAGITTIVASAAKVEQIVATGLGGTIFVPQTKKLKAKDFWLRNIAITTAGLYIDWGAVAAITSGKNSLLIPGIVKQIGRFTKGDVVDIFSPAEKLIAKGIVTYDDYELAAKIKTKISKSDTEVIHADNLVII